MKCQMRNLFIILLSLIFLVLPLGARAAGEPRLRLSTDKLAPVTVGQEVTITLLIENAPLIYGIESHLGFEPTMLEVVELKHGNFLSPHPATQTFILQNQADNQTGAIDYALALLNPAPPVSGNGQVATITFRVKAAGSTTIEIKEAMLGTQTGEEIIPVVESAELTISDVRLNQPTVEMTSAEESPAIELPPAPNESDPLEETISMASRWHPRRAYGETNPGYGLWLGPFILGLGVIIGLISLVGIVGLMGGWYLITRTRRRQVKVRR